MEKFTQGLNKASNILKIADHMLYVTYPLIKEKRLLLKILTEIYLSVLNIINSILQYEYLHKNIQLFKDSKTNFTIFMQRCVPKYKISLKELEKIKEIFNLAEKHKNSPFEFVRNEKVVIMTNTLKTSTITIEQIKLYLIVAKNLLRKAETIILTKNQNS